MAGFIYGISESYSKRVLSGHKIGCSNSKVSYWDLRPTTNYPLDALLAKWMSSMLGIKYSYNEGINL